MDDRRRLGEMNDGALAREIEGALAVDPSAEFLPRVRARVEQESRPGAVWRWSLVPATAVVVVAIWVGGSLISRAPSLPLIPATFLSKHFVAEPQDVVSQNISGLVREVATPPRSPATAPALAEVVISPDDAVALRGLVMLVQQGRFDSSMLVPSQEGTAVPERVAEMAIQPIVIEPLAPLALLQGEQP